MLRVTLHVNQSQIADYEIRNVTPPTRKPPIMCDYEVRSIDDDWMINSKPLLTVTHKRDEGAHVLASKVLSRLARLHP